MKTQHHGTTVYRAAPALHVVRVRVGGCRGKPREAAARVARGSRGGGEAAGGRHHVAEGLLQQGAGAGGGGAEGGAGDGAEAAVQHVLQTRHAATQYSTSASWPSRGWPGCRVCGCARASRASWTAATRGRGPTCPGSWGRCRRAAGAGSAGGGCVMGSPGMRASCGGSEADWRSFSSCVRWSVAWKIIRILISSHLKHSVLQLV